MFHPTIITDYELSAQGRHQELLERARQVRFYEQYVESQPGAFQRVVHYLSQATRRWQVETPSPATKPVYERQS